MLKRGLNEFIEVNYNNYIKSLIKKIVTRNTTSDDEKRRSTENRRIKSTSDSFNLLIQTCLIYVFIQHFIKLLLLFIMHYFLQLVYVRLRVVCKALLLQGHLLLIALTFTIWRFLLAADLICW